MCSFRCHLLNNGLIDAFTCEWGHMFVCVLIGKQEK